jgi:hypothetical protein
MPSNLIQILLDLKFILFFGHRKPGYGYGSATLSLTILYSRFRLKREESAEWAAFRTGEYDMNEMEEDISNGIDFRSVKRPLGLENTT